MFFFFFHSALTFPCDTNMGVFLTFKFIDDLLSIVDKCQAMIEFLAKLYVVAYQFGFPRILPN